MVISNLYVINSQNNQNILLSKLGQIIRWKNQIGLSFLSTAYYTDNYVSLTQLLLKKSRKRSLCGFSNVLEDYADGVMWSALRVVIGQHGFDVVIVVVAFDVNYCC